MVTIKQLVQEQILNDMTDIQLVKMFFTINDMEEEAIDLISELTKSKIHKTKQKYKSAEEWITILPSDYLYKNYDLDTADSLHRLELDYLIHGCELSKSMFKWAQENIPNIKMPRVYFKPLIDYMEEHGIEFKK